jgi:hypothetical protein
MCWNASLKWSTLLSWTVDRALCNLNYIYLTWLLFTLLMTWQIVCLKRKVNNYILENSEICSNTDRKLYSLWFSYYTTRVKIHLQYWNCHHTLWEWKKNHYNNIIYSFHSNWIQYNCLRLATLSSDWTASFNWSKIYFLYSISSDAALLTLTTLYSKVRGSAG